MHTLYIEDILLEEALRADSLIIIRKHDKTNILPAIWIINLLPLDTHKDKTSS